MTTDKDRIIQFLDELKAKILIEGASVTGHPIVSIEEVIAEYPPEHEAQMKSIHTLRYKTGMRYYHLTVQVVDPIPEIDRVEGLHYQDHMAVTL